MKFILLVPAIFVVAICGCSPDGGALAKAKMDADTAKADAENARAAQSRAEGNLTIANTELALERAKQTNLSKADMAHMQAETVKMCLMQINRSYAEASLNLKRPPKDLEEFKRHIAKEFLVSNRDKQPFDVAWGEPPPALLAWEHTSDATGRRWIVLREHCLEPSYVDEKVFQLIASVISAPPKIIFTPGPSKEGTK